MSTADKASLTLGPLLFHWPGARRRDFYFRIADEAPIDTVYLGEVVCAKRASVFAPFRDEVIERLRAAGKQVVVSTLALVTTAREIEEIRELAAGELLLEANDVACLAVLAGRPHVVGPYINVFNEGSRDVVVRGGARRIVLPVEIPARSVGIVADVPGAVEIELQAFGRQPLAVAMRCYHARAHERTKDHCQLVCGLDADGLTASTVDGREILTVNGTQTLTHGCVALLHELAALREAGVGHFRLSPQALDMVAVARLFRDVLDGRVEPSAAAEGLRAQLGSVPLINGFLHGREGLAWVDPATAPLTLRRARAEFAPQPSP